MTKDENQTAKGGGVNISLVDVRAVLTDANPNETNASKVRALIGRGSHGTIQKHLMTLRAEAAAAAAPPVAVDHAPTLPAEAAQAIWLAAWTAAQVQTLRRTETLASERDVALLKLETMSQDVSGLVAAIDAQAADFDERTEMFRGEIFGLNQNIERMDDEAAIASRIQTEQKTELMNAAAELAKVQSDAAHAAELAVARQEGMRGELARLTDQVGELKAALYRRAEPIQIPVAI